MCCTRGVPADMILDRETSAVGRSAHGPRDARFGGGRDVMSKVRVDRKGKVVLVTGAGNGLGRAASVALAEAGALVGIASKTPS